jgi:Transmembrane secretion effector
VGRRSPGGGARGAGASLTRLLRAIVVDVGPLRSSRQLRLLVGGGVVSSVGTQITLVALPYQVYLLTRSSLAVGLIGLVELVPLVASSLASGALADRFDRRRLLLAAQCGLLATSLALALGSLLGPPPVGLLYGLAALAAAGSGLDRPTRSAILPNVVEREQLPAAIAANYGLFQLTMVVGPAVGGVILAAAGVAAAYLVDVASFVAMIAAAAALAPQRPLGVAEGGERFLAAIAGGLSFAWRNGALMGSFVVDIQAMTFGMPRALFPALSLGVYHAGAAGVGFLFAAVSAGAAIAAFSTGWVGRVRRLGRVVVFAVAVWGAAITLAGLTGSLYVAMACLAAAGAADSVSAVCRSTIMQVSTPDHMRGRMGSIFTFVVAGGPRLGDVESGSVASAFTPQISVVSGGLLCLAGLVPLVLLFPDFWHYGARAPAPPG